MTEISSSSNHTDQKSKTSLSTFSLSLRSTGKPPIKIPNNNIEIITPESLEIVKIDGYRQSLMKNGFAELDIPEELKKRFEKINEIILETHLKAKDNPHIQAKKRYIDNSGKNLYTKKIPGTEEYYHNVFEEFYKEELDKKSKKYINNTSKIYQSYLCNTIEEIFKKDNFVLFVNSTGTLNIRMERTTGNMFHKDTSFAEAYNSELKPIINAIYPFLGAKGTAYIPYKIKQEKYIEAPKEDQQEHKKDTDDYVFYKKNTDIENKKGIEDIKHADNNKIFIFLTRKASRSLGADYDNKSLVHAVPEYTDPLKERVYFHHHVTIKELKM